MTINRTRSYKQTCTGTNKMQIFKDIMLKAKRGRVKQAREPQTDIERERPRQRSKWRNRIRNRETEKDI